MNELFQKKPALIITSLAAVVTLAYLFGLFLPKQKAIAQNQKKLELCRQSVAEGDQLRLAIYETTHTLEETERYIETKRAALPSLNEMDALNCKITEEIEKEGITIKRFEPHAPEKLASLTLVPVFLIVEGSFDEIYSMIGRLEQLEAPIWFDMVQLERQGLDKEEVRCELNLVIFADPSGNSP